MSGSAAGQPERPTVRDLLLARAEDDRPGPKGDDLDLTWRAYVHGCAARAEWLLARRPADPAPFHVGLLAGNTVEHALWLGACALAGAVAVGLNTTRADAELRRDARHADVFLVLADDAHVSRCMALVADQVAVRAMDAIRGELAPTPDTVPNELPSQLGVKGGPDDLFMLIFTSGTTSDPKAVKCSHGRLAHSGSMVALMNELGPDDVALTTMPLFHSNAVIAGWVAALSCGARWIVRDFSASGFVQDLRTSGVTYANYVGKALTYVLAVPAEADDAQVPLRAVFGNEASEATIRGFAERFGCAVTDAYGSTEGGISLLRTDQTPVGSLGVALGDVRVLDEHGNECPRLAVDQDGHASNLEAAIGEFVNLDGPGGFEGYWNNPEADASRLRSGRFHSGDLGWRDEAGFFWFAGRTGEWLRVDGENLAVAPIERALGEHPAVTEAVVVGLPDPDAGDQVLACLEVQDATAFDVTAFGEWCARRDDLSAKSMPRFVHAEPSLPRGPTNKVLRQVVRQRGLSMDGPIWWRPDRANTFVPWGT